MVESLENSTWWPSIYLFWHKLIPPSLHVHDAAFRQQMESDNEKQEREKQAIIVKMNAAIEENQKTIKAERETHEEDVDRLTREKAELRCDHYLHYVYVLRSKTKYSTDRN